jgi:epoxyqueuosine reductase
MEDKKAAIRRRALGLGFPLCGFTAARPTEHFSVYRQWIDAGRQAGMRYLSDARALEERSDPRRFFPSARTIIALAMPYPAPQPPENLPLEGFVAAYALGDDYHEIIRARLRLLAGFLNELENRKVESRGCVDTAPVLERETASRAGLGWIGRNSMLIHPEIGSFTFLAEIITDLELPPDPPFSADRCGSCDRCLRACPTGCILPNRTIDSRRCISFLTIEHRGPIPEILRPAVGRAVFGCDICQTVCPWNRRPTPAVDEAFLPRAHFPIRDLAKEYLLPEKEWKERFRRSAIRRTGREGYRRNLLIALGNTRHADARAVLETARRDPDPLLNGSAEWALRQIAGKKA